MGSNPRLIGATRAATIKQEAHGEQRVRPPKTLLDATIVAAFVGGVFALGTSWFGAHEMANQRVQQAEARSVDLQAQQMKAYYEARSVACKVAGDWFMDEKPNASLPKEARQLLIEDMRSSLKACDIPSPLPSSHIINRQPIARFSVEGGNFGGGGAGNAY